MKKAAIIQSSYIPWKGFFDIIHDVDVFVFFDCVQFTKRDWRTRNYIKTPEGIKMISVPVSATTTLPINQINIDLSQNWQEKHHKTFQMNYGSADCFNEFKFLLDDIYKKKRWENLSELNQASIKLISQALGIKTEFVDSRELSLTGNKTDRLIDALNKVNANYYISGPAAEGYIENEKFERAGIKLKYKDYTGYPQYKQLWGDFTHQVSILDLLLNAGKKAPDYIWRWRDEA